MSTLRKIREASGLRQIDVAKMSGIGLTTVWLIENGYENRVSQKTKEKIATALKMKVREIFPQS